MQNSFITLIFTAAFGAIYFPVFGQENKMSTKSTNETSSTLLNLKALGADSTVLHQKYLKEAELRIVENEKSIAELKSKKLTGKMEEINLFFQKVIIEEKINNELKTRLDEAVKMKSKGWSSFSTEFDIDIADLERSLKKLSLDYDEKMSVPVNP